MNETSRPARRPATNTQRASEFRRRRGERLAIVVALEALEAGDQELAVAVLLGALEDGHRKLRARCGCGAAFEWPGLRDEHITSGACPLVESEAA
jgi:hypothetical protein